MSIAATTTYSASRLVASPLTAASGRHGFNQAAADGCVTLARRFVR
jgi:hypothetical protein